MTIAFYCVLIAAFIPVIFTGIAKFSGPGFNNRKPRDFQAGLSGSRLRAHWAHLNGFEAFPPFAAAVIIRHVSGGQSALVDQLAIAFVVLRFAFGFAYMADIATLRSILWLGAVCCWVAMYFV